MIVYFFDRKTQNPTFFSTTVSPGMALEDGNVLMLHSHDLGNHVCVMPMEGYGEATEANMPSDNQQKDGSNGSGVAELADEMGINLKDGADFRGERNWRDQTGGATVCCNKCHAILGFASIGGGDDESMRIYKHRLRAGDAFVNHTCGSFLSKEMIRYAESQAVYTFIVSVRGEDDFGQCLLLRLLSWDTRIAIDGREKCSDAIKVIYEERCNWNPTPNGFGANDSSNPNTWSWGNLDFCCPPGTVEKHDVSNNIESSVRVHLAIDEWTNLKKELKEGAQRFPSSLSEASVLLKIGMGKQSNRAKLTYITLL